MVEGNGQEVAWVEALVQVIVTGHDRILRETGGLPGVQAARLSSACARPFQSAFGEEAFPTHLYKAAALFHAVIHDHPFADGNKRTATFAAFVLLRALGYLVEDPSPLQIRFLGELAVETAVSHSIEVEEIADWFERILGPRG